MGASLGELVRALEELAKSLERSANNGPAQRLRALGRQLSSANASRGDIEEALREITTMGTIVQYGDFTQPQESAFFNKVFPLAKKAMESL